MALRETSTKEKLLELIDDIDIASRELFDKMVTHKADKLSPSDQSQLIQLIMSKNEDLKEVFELATEQGEIDAKMVTLTEEVNREDEELQSLEKSLKEAETVLSTALFQAKQKLDQMTKAQEHSVSSEDLIRFAHRISSTNAVAAPVNWTPGDPRRPYPTDLEMRMGFLGKLSELPPTAPATALLDYANNSSGFPPYGSNGSGENPILVSGSYVHPSSLHPPQFSTSVGVDPSTRNHEDVDLMSSDSSSTSSSDSQ